MNVTNEVISAELRSLPFTSEWSDEIIAELGTISKTVEFATGTVVFPQGAENQELYLICSGRVALDMVVPARGPVRILTLARGDLLAWSAVVGDHRMTVTATALEPVRAISIDGVKLQSLCDLRHDIGYAVMRKVARTLAQRLTATRLQLLDLYVHNTPHFLRPVEGSR
jgi:CRP/FNR family cyclic AMP-dependent transcriptional regulator